MVIGKGIPSRDEFFKITLAKRSEATEELKLASEAGDRRKIAAWQSEIRKIDKLLAKFGMRPNA